MSVYQEIKQKCPENCEILIVSKRRTADQIRRCYDEGARDFGENRVQELLEKAGQLPSDIRWTLIGHLQRNKVRAVLPVLYRLASLDSLTLAEILEKECVRLNRTLPVLAEFNLAEEATKTGMPESEALPFFQALRQYPHLIPQGIMVIGPHTEDTQAIAAVFRRTRRLFDTLKAEVGEAFTVCSMGMSQDYPIAIQEGSTQLRLGTILFTDDQSKNAQPQ